jgi:C-terminal processing protease CtpA/Prc
MEQNPQGEVLGYELLAEPSTALLTVGSFSIERSQQYDTFLSASFQDMADKQIENLIIDVRGNGGGDPEFSADLIAYLMDEPFTYFSQANGYSDLIRSQ